MVDHAAIGRRSSRIGKEGERGVLRAVRANGFPGADNKHVERRDRLDLTLCDGVIASVKAGEQARSASLGDISAWHAEANEKRRHVGAALALLIVQRRGYGMDPERVLHWRCWVIGHDGNTAYPEDRDFWEAQLARALAYVLALQRAGEVW